MALSAMANLLQDKGERICQAWQRFAPRKLWAGLSLEEFRSRVRLGATESKSIHYYAEKAELILDVLTAIERDPEAGRNCPLYLALSDVRAPGEESQQARLAA